MLVTDCRNPQLGHDARHPLLAAFVVRAQGDLGRLRHMQPAAGVVGNLACTDQAV